MAIWAQKKIMKMTKGMKRRSNCFRIGIRRVFKALQYKYRDRRQKKRNIRRHWILIINNALREHGIRYSRFIYELNHSNVGLNRKMLADLAVNEPYSFKATIDHIMAKSTVAGAFIENPCATVGFNQAFEKGLLSFKAPDSEPTMKPMNVYGLRFPERDAKDPDKDYLRISLREEDKEWMKERQRYTLTEKEQKRLPREVIEEDWQEDMSMYDHKKGFK